MLVTGPLEPRLRTVVDVLRWAFTVAALGGAIYLTLMLTTNWVFHHVSVRPQGTQEIANWAPLFLAFTVILFLAQVYFVALSSNNAKYSVVSFSFTVVLFVQSGTLLAAFVITQTTGVSEVMPWVLPAIVSAVIILLVLVLAQGHALLWTRGRIQRNFEQQIQSVVQNTPGLNLPASEVHVLLSASRYIIPLDIYPFSGLSIASENKQAWTDLEQLWNIRGVSLGNMNWNWVRGNASSELWGSYQVYADAGILAAFVGSITLVLVVSPDDFAG